MDLKRVMMFFVEWLATPPEEQQSVPVGSLGGVSLLDLITEQGPHVFNWVDVRGLCRPVHHINPSISEECCANSRQCVVECCHAETSLPLDGSAWIPCRISSLYRTPLRLPWITARSVRCHPEIPPHTMRDAPPPYMSVSLMHGSTSLSFLLFHTLSPPSTLSSMNWLSSDIRIWFWIWFWIWTWSFISTGTKAKWQDLELRCLGG